MPFHAIVALIGWAISGVSAFDTTNEILREVVKLEEELKRVKAGRRVVITGDAAKADKYRHFVASRRMTARYHLGNGSIIPQGFLNTARLLSTGQVPSGDFNETFAQEIQELVSNSAGDLGGMATALDHAWLILCGALVMLMQAGFAMVEAGVCRVRSVQNIMLKNFVDVCLGTLVWWAFGWAIAYGAPEYQPFAGSEETFGQGFTSVDDNGIITPTSKMRDWFFQWAFCSAASTIVSGGIAERVQFPGYIFFTVAMTGFIYPTVVHMTWGGGWLAGGDEPGQINSVGYMDFAGSGIVHMCGGVAALVGSVVVGPRSGRFITDENFDPHNLPLVILGTFILWFGWYGFNCGSTLALSSTETGQLAAQVAMNTTLAAATGGATALAVRWIVQRRYDIGCMCNGILAGLVSITAGCGNVSSGSSVVIGFIGALVMLGASAMQRKLHIDDPVDAFAVHGAAGAWGVLAAAIFDWGSAFYYFHGWNGFNCVTDPDGSCMPHAWKLAFEANVAQVFVISLYTAALSICIFGPLRMMGALRSSDKLQELGADAAKHSPSKAYHGAHGSSTNGEQDDAADTTPMAAM